MNINPASPIHRPQSLLFAGRTRETRPLDKKFYLRNHKARIPGGVAIVELGGNAARSLVLSENGEFHTFRKKWDNAKAIGEKKQVLDSALRRYVITLFTLKDWLKAHHIDAKNVVVKATAGIRSAENQGLLMDIGKALGFNISVIDGFEEARLCYLATTRSEGLKLDEKAMVIDIGGGSTVVALGTGPTGYEPSLSRLFQMGSSRLGMQDPWSPGSIRAIRGKVNKALKDNMRQSGKKLKALRKEAAGRRVFIKESSLEALAVVHMKLHALPLRRKELPRTCIAGEDIRRDVISREEIRFYLSKKGLKVLSEDAYLNTQLKSNGDKIKLVVKLVILDRLMGHLNLKGIELGFEGGPQYPMLDEAIDDAMKAPANGEQPSDARDQSVAAVSAPDFDRVAIVTTPPYRRPAAGSPVYH